MLEMNKLYLMNCMDLMKQFPDKYFELAIVDPPYGIDINSSGRLGGYGGKGKTWDNQVPDKAYFDELFRVSKNQIVWGGNYFNLPPTRCFLIWDKRQPENVSFASCELAWTSLDQSAKTFYYSPLQKEDTRIHPTQKPIKLYEWILSRYAQKGDKILDTHVGSGSSLIAAYHMNFDYIGSELDPDYFKAATERIEAVKAQTTLF